MALSYGTVGWSAVCDCGIFGLYSLTILQLYIFLYKLEIFINT